MRKALHSIHSIYTLDINESGHYSCVCMCRRKPHHHGRVCPLVLCIYRSRSLVVVVRELCESGNDKIYRTTEDSQLVNGSLCKEREIGRECNLLALLAVPNALSLFVSIFHRERYRVCVCVCVNCCRLISC